MTRRNLPWHRKFQSTPALWDGRFLEGLKWNGSNTCFNPRPPFGTGASAPLVMVQLFGTVSIHARPLGRALLLVDRHRKPDVYVSIHARPLGRALPSALLLSGASIMFQSTPALWDGRFAAQPPGPSRTTCFNPRPPFGTGASPDADPQHQPEHVSIHARPLGRALPNKANSFITPPQFQSTPALWDGRFLLGEPTIAPLTCFNPRPPFGTGASGN
ncbi:protein of unknown function [Trichlorobacter ammonificans]|uniref:Uncharacterized protein n=1 Tax=Trichlorobacter ammonificans TaxID=2916410 RepID=A0ABM9D6B5_9BACT|nr:protein of unknown function [Trichlorobacter ammonificans]